MYNVAASVAYM